MTLRTQIWSFIWLRNACGLWHNKMQCMLADFAPGASTQRMGQNWKYTHCLMILGNLLHYIKAWHHRQNGKYTIYCNAVRVRLRHGHKLHVQAMWWNLDTFLRHENRETDMVAAILCIAIGHKVKISCKNTKFTLTVNTNTVKINNKTVKLTL